MNKIDKAFEKWFISENGEQPTEYDKDGYCTEDFKKWENKRLVQKTSWEQSRIDTLIEFKKFQNDIEDVTSNNFAELVMIPHRIHEWINAELKKLQ